jgi:hypothetical protein
LDADRSGGLARRCPSLGQVAVHRRSSMNEIETGDWLACLGDNRIQTVFLGELAPHLALSASFVEPVLSRAEERESNDRTTTQTAAEVALVTTESESSVPLGIFQDPIGCKLAGQDRHWDAPGTVRPLAGL